MLGPIRDPLSPKDPMSAPLLCSIKDRYLSSLSVGVDPERPGSEETRWIRSGDANAGHLLGVFTTVCHVTSGGVWDACANFIRHLYWHKLWLVMLGPRIEALVDDHPSMLECLFQLLRLFWMVGNHVERKWPLVHALKFSREQGDGHQLIRTLRQLSDVYLLMGRDTTRKRSTGNCRGDTEERALCLVDLVWLLRYDNELDRWREPHLARSVSS